MFQPSRRFVRALVFTGFVGLCAVPGVHADSSPATVIQKTNTSTTLMAVQFKDAKVGWAVGSGGALFTTVDGGKKWKKQTSGTSALLTGVYFIDQKTGWVTGAGGTLRRSTNGGDSWTGHPLETQQPLYGVHFPSANEGWVVGGGGTILHTADGGAHWVEQASGTSEIGRAHV